MPPRNDLKVVHLCYADDRGGAAIGARRSHLAMLSQGVNSYLVVVEKYSDDNRVIPLPTRPLRRKLVRKLNTQITKLQKSGNPIIRTLNLIPMGTARFLNALEADIVQMHWVAADTISIGEIAAIRSPVVWKLPDMWPFSGAEHYLNPNDIPRYREGYVSSNRQHHESGLDLDRLIWRYKRFRWRHADFSVVGPSRWVTQCARESVLFGHRRIRHIPNPLDLDLYRPVPTDAARAELGLPQDKRLVMFGAMYAAQDTRKGFQHLKQALEHLRGLVSETNTELVILGADGGPDRRLSGFRTHYLGTIRDESRLVTAYNTADAFVLPAEADNLPNVVKEAIACGVPCAGFDIGGMPDMVEHLSTGYLARPYDAQDLAQGIAWVIERAGPALKLKVRNRAAEEHNHKIAVERYLDFYEEIRCSRNRNAQ